MNTQATVIDVRTPGEFAGGNVQGSINIPLDTIAQRLNEIKAINNEIILCCASGGRSYMAKQFLNQQGLSNIQDGGPWQMVAMQKSA